MTPLSTAFSRVITTSPPSSAINVTGFFQSEKSWIGAISGSMKYSNSAMLNSRKRIIP